MSKIYLWALLGLSCLLTACSGDMNCEDDEVIDTIRQIIAEHTSNGAADAILAAEINDVFAFKKSDDGRWTCKARMIVQTSENTFEDEFHYAVNNYESGFEVEVDDDAAPLLNRVNGVYVRIANAEAAKQTSERAAERQAEIEAFMDRFPSGNVCAEKLDQNAFVSNHVDTQVTINDVGYHVGQFPPEIERQVVNDFASAKVGVAEIQTIERSPVSREDLENSQMNYRCTGALQAMVGGSNVRGDTVSFSLLSSDGLSFTLNYSGGIDKMKMPVVVNNYADQLVTGK